MDLRIVQRTHPLIEVQISGNRHFRQAQRRRRLTYTCIYFLYMTDGSILNHIDRSLELFAGTLLATYLKHTFVITYSLHHSQAFGDRISQRFLAIYVFSGLTRMDGSQSMPMVRGSDLDSVDILTLQQILVKLILITTLVHSL